MRKIFFFLSLITVVVGLNAQNPSSSPSKNMIFDDPIVVRELKNQNDVLKRIMIKYLNKTSYCNITAEQLSSMNASNEILKRQVAHYKIDSVSSSLQIIDDGKEISLKQPTNSVNETYLNQLQKSVESIFGSLAKRFKIEQTDQEVIMVVKSEDLFFTNEPTRFFSEFTESLATLMTTLRSNKLLIQIDDSNASQREKSLARIEHFQKKLNEKNPSLSKRVSFQQETDLIKIFNSDYKSSNKVIKFILTR